MSLKTLIWDLWGRIKYGFQSMTIISKSSGNQYWSIVGRRALLCKRELIKNVEIWGMHQKSSRETYLKRKLKVMSATNLKAEELKQQFASKFYPL